MKLINKIAETFNRTKTAFNRYPLVMLFVILSAFSFIAAVIYREDSIFNTSINLGPKYEMRFGYLFILASVVVFFLYLLFESLSQIEKTPELKRRNKLIKIIISIVAIISIGSMGKETLFDDNSVALFAFENGYVYFGLVFTFVIGCFFIAKIFYHSDFIAYVIKIITSAIISVGYSVVIIIGMLSIYFALWELFEISVDDNIIVSTIILILLPLNGGIFLSHFPKASASFENYEMIKPIRVLIIYILLPIFTIYALIIYLYFGKIVFTKEIPQGGVVNLILWFSLLEVALMFILGKVNEIKPVKLFKKYFPIIMLPLLCILFYAIIFRIRDYGITENRYFVLAGGIFCLSSNLYYMIYRKNSNITIPIILAIIAIISTVGPMSAYRISAESQNMRMKKILERNKMLSGQGIIPSENIDSKDKWQIVDITNYMTTNHRPWEFEYVPINYTNTDSEFEKVFGFSRDANNSFGEGINFIYENNSSIDVSGYSKLMTFEFDASENATKTIGNYKVYSMGDKISVDIQGKQGYKNLFNFSVKDVMDKVRVLKESNKSIVLDDIVIKGSSNDIIYKVVFTELREVYGSGNSYYYYIKFNLITGTV